MSLATQAEPAMLPTPPRQRLPILDVWRGLALLGVIIVNFVIANEDYLTAAQAAALPTESLDWKGLLLVQSLLGDKFNTIFTLLFGIGFAILEERSSPAGRDAALLRRRTLLLLTLGWVNCMLLYPGELLHIYGVLGMLLLLLRSLPDRALFVLGAVLTVLPRLIFYEWPFVTDLFGMVPTRWPPFGSELGSDAAAAARYQVLHHGGVWQILTNNLSLGLALDWRPFRIAGGLYLFGRILLGYVLWRSGLLQRLLSRRISPLAACSLIGVGVAVSAYLAIAPWGRVGTLGHFVFTAMREICIPVLAFGYLLGAAIVTRWASMSNAVQALAAVGRMSLTNYLLQGLAMFLILYGPGLRIAGDIGASTAVVLAVMLFAVQMWASVLWLKHFDSGPAEWLWRRLSYGVSPSRRVAEAA